MMNNELIKAFSLEGETALITVGAVHRMGAMGNWFTGFLGGLFVCSSVLSAETILALADATIPGRSAEMLGTMKACEQNLDYTAP